MNAFSVDDSGPMQRLVRHVLGADEGARRHILRLSRQWWLLVVCGGLLAASATLGLESAGACLLTMSVGALAVGVGYVLLRSGWSRRCRDPSLAWPQLLASIVTVVLSYGLIDIARGAALQLLCLLLAFEMDRLSRRQLLTASLFAVSLLCLTALLRVRFGADPPDIPREVFDLVMAAVLLPVAIAVGGEVGRWRARLDEQRATLAATLSELERLSTSDALTGITNRRQMSLLLEQEEKRQRRGGAPFWIAIVDIDWFKQINDRYGHATGDAVLRDFAALCASQLDVDDVVARWGGEEFLLLLPATSEERALATLARIRAAVARHDWQAHAGGLAPGFSGGLAVHRADEALAHTLERADRALYAAKEAGRDRIWSAESARRIEGFVATARDAQGGRLAVTTAPMMRPVGTAEPTPVSPGVRPTSRWQRAVDLLMSRDPAIREALRLPVACYALQWMWMLVIVGHALPAGQISPLAAATLCAGILPSMVLFYTLIRSGWSQRLRDPVLVLPQMIWSSLLVTFGYVTSPLLAPSLLHMLCVIQVFGMVSLKPWESRVAGWTAVGILCLAWLSMLGSGRPDLTAETLKMLLAIFIVGHLAWLSRRYGELRAKVEDEQAGLADTVARLEEVVVRDALTGQYNRKYIEAQLTREHQRAARTGRGYALALIDLDHFKQINDRYGHHAGDRVLADFAHAAAAALRETDELARWGGEEFIVLMRDVDTLEEGFGALARLRAACADLRVAPTVDAGRVTFSAGLAVSHPDDTPATLLERADRALYAAKAGGRNRDEHRELAREPALTLVQSDARAAVG